MTDTTDGDVEAAKKKQKQFIILCAVLGVCTVIFLVMMVLLAYTLPNASG
ncbi:MAG: hypothetical protein JST89_07075 [Cyanobacteria bacterium SZAS-4]|nr:hypothetical protein [Cyanobacteria bacterium SZAS-4]